MVVIIMASFQNVGYIRVSSFGQNTERQLLDVKLDKTFTDKYKSFIDEFEEEQEKFIDHHFTKQLIQQITGMQGRDLEKFMTVYRPPYEFIAFSEEYEFHQYILNASKYFKQGILPKAKVKE